MVTFLPKEAKFEVMQKTVTWLTALIFSLALFSCNKKVVPNKPTHTASMPAKGTEKKKPAAPKPPTAKSIMVNDSVAKKTFDGRLYYDLDGKRYWKNYKDGKYYLYNKSQHSDPDFKPKN